jgi:hypothetical protein
MLLQLASSLWNDDAAFQQHSPQLVDQCRPLTDQAVPRPVERLDVELRLRFQLDKAHGRPCRGFSDRFGIAVIVLLRFDIRPYVLR